MGKNENPTDKQLKQIQDDRAAQQRQAKAERANKEALERAANEPDPA
jgi:hypothetical protein